MTEEVERQDALDEEIFSYRATKDGKVLLYWHNKQVKILKGLAAQKFLQSMIHATSVEAQLLMAKVTGNFKRGNERS